MSLFNFRRRKADLGRHLAVRYSHSIVAGGLLDTS